MHIVWVGKGDYTCISNRWTRDFKLFFCFYNFKCDAISSIDAAEDKKNSTMGHSFIHRLQNEMIKEDMTADDKYVHHIFTCPVVVIPMYTVLIGQLCWKLCLAVTCIST